LANALPALTAVLTEGFQNAAVGFIHDDVKRGAWCARTRLSQLDFSNRKNKAIDTFKFLWRASILTAYHSRY
jgi:hypothetical protein